MTRPLLAMPWVIGPLVWILLSPLVGAEWLVRVDSAQTAEMMKQTGLRPVRHYRHFPWALYRGGEPAEQAFARDKERLGVTAAPNSTVRLAATPNDPLFTGQITLNPNGNLVAAADIFLREAWERRSSADDVLVAVIDSGLDVNHEDFQGNLWTNAIEEAGDPGVDDDQNGFVDDLHGWNVIEGGDQMGPNGDLTDTIGHGTQVCGVLGARGNNGVGIAGTCWEVSMMAVRAFESEMTEVANILAAFDYVLNFPRVRIINASWGDAEMNEAMRDVIASMEENILIVTSPGNDGVSLDDTPMYPSSFNFDNVVSVAAINTVGQLASFSNFGSMVTLAAPGVSVVTTSAPPDEAYTVVQGTSFATPRVTGAAVLLMAEYPDLTPPQVKELLLSTSRATTELSGAELQGGLLDVNSLLGTSLNTAPFWTLY